jgi:hypothetical protein
LIVGSARRAKRCHRNHRQGAHNSFRRIEKHAGDLHTTASIALPGGAKKTIQIIKASMPAALRSTVVALPRCAKQLWPKTGASEIGQVC